jgi:hypothetical protein
MQYWSLYHSVLLILCASGLLGCGRTGPAIDKPAIERLSLLGEAYLQATQKHNRGPKNSDELKACVAPPHQLEELLVSPHDGKPYVIVWNIDPRQPPATEIPPLIAYEQEGRGGQHDALTTMGIVRINRQELDKYIAATPGARAP